MAYDYGLWLWRGKRNRITPIWAALVTIVLAPFGYWFCGDGYRGLKYTVVIFFAGYVTLGLATFIGSVILAADVYRVSMKHEQKIANSEESIEYSKYGSAIKLVFVAVLLISGVLTYLFFSLI